MPSFFARLPTELQAKVLQTIINTGAGSLIPFLRAFPDLAHLVLLISDHPDSENQLVDIPGVEAVDLEDHQLIARLRPAKPIRVLSFKNCDEEAGVGRLTRSSDCAYGKYMDSKSAVFVELRGKALLGKPFIKQLAELKGCVLGTTFLIDHLRNKVSSSHVEMDRTGNIHIQPVISTKVLTNYIFDDPEIPWILGLPFNRYFMYMVRWTNITHFTVLNPLCLSTILALPHVETIRISAQHRGCTDTTYVNPSRGRECVDPVYGLNGASRAKNIYIEFVASMTPTIFSGPRTCSKVTEGEKFAFVNLDWSDDNTGLERGICRHAIRARCGYELWSYRSYQQPLTFLKIFKDVTFTGIPDRTILVSSLTETRHLTWKRLTPSNSPPRTVRQGTIKCPSLKCLELSTLLRRKDNKAPIPKIDAPVLQSMDLRAVYGSNTAWNLPFHFSKETLASVENVSMVFKQREGTPGLAIWLADIEPLTQSLRSLTLGGCLPSFLLNSEDTLESNVVFSRLRRLSVDMEYLPLETINGKPRPLVSVLLDRDTFPVLEDLTLTVEFPDRSPLLSGGVCDVKIQVTSSCQFLTVPYDLAGNHFFMVKEDEERCQAVNITREKFLPAAGEPGFVRASLEV